MFVSPSISLKPAVGVVDRNSAPYSIEAILNKTNIGATTLPNPHMQMTKINLPIVVAGDIKGRLPYW